MCVELKISKLIKYSTMDCWTRPCTIVACKGNSQINLYMWTTIENVIKMFKIQHEAQRIHVIFLGHCSCKIPLPYTHLSHHLFHYGRTFMQTCKCMHILNIVHMFKTLGLLKIIT